MNKPSELFLALCCICVAMPLSAQDTKDEDASVLRRTSFFNERWLDAVVSIERLVESPGKETTAQALGTGFLVKEEGLVPVLVTAAHVILDKKGELQPKLNYRRSDVDGEDALISDDQLARAGAGEWVFSDSQELAARRFGWAVPGKPPVVLPASHFMNMDLLDVGAPLLVLGFPTGLRSTTHKHPIARRGSVARFGPEGLLVEAFVFPGNSGGPVVYVPTLKVRGHLTSPLVNEEQLVGVVSSYVAYQEGAVSSQTGRLRMVFEENSGLANVIPIDELEKLLESAFLKPVTQ